MGALTSKMRSPPSYRFAALAVRRPQPAGAALVGIVEVSVQRDDEARRLGASRGARRRPLGRGLAAMVPRRARLCRLRRLPAGCPAAMPCRAAAGGSSDGRAWIGVRVRGQHGAPRALPLPPAAADAMQRLSRSGTDAPLLLRRWRRISAAAEPLPHCCRRLRR